MRANRLKTLTIIGIASASLIAATIVQTPAISGAAPKSTIPQLTLAATHPKAAAQSTATGQRRTDLHVHDGKVWAGSGDYGANTGPITTAAYEPAAGTGFESAFVTDSEAVYNPRTVGDDLVAPATDPRSRADFAVGSPWSE